MLRRIWTWLLDEHNRGALALLIAILIGGPWAIFTFFYAPGPTAEEGHFEPGESGTAPDPSPGEPDSAQAIAGVWDSGTRTYTGVRFHVVNRLTPDGRFAWTGTSSQAQDIWVNGTWRVEGNEIVSVNTETNVAAFPLNQPIYTKFEMLSPTAMRYRDPINGEWVTAARID